jgi:hypothetical protein
LQVMNKIQRKNMKEVQMKKGMRGMGRKRWMWKCHSSKKC